MRSGALLGPRGTLDSPPEPPIAKRIAATRSPLSATTEEERYIYEVQESETGESVQDAGELLDLTPQQTSPDYTSKFVVSMYEDYAIVQLKLKSRQGVKRRFRLSRVEPAYALHHHPEFLAPRLGAPRSHRGPRAPLLLQGPIPKLAGGGALRRVA